MTIEQVKELSAEIEQFHASSQEAIFCLLVGTLNHWVVLVVHKTESEVDNELSKLNRFAR